MITVEKLNDGYMLNILEFGGGAWERIPCVNMDEIHIEAHKRGFSLQDNYQVWHTVHMAGDDG